MPSANILFLVAHPQLEHSKANHEIAEVVANLPGITTRKLYDLYPYFEIDVELEQEILRQHDLIAIQHPLYWYSMPPLLKMWLDEVWESGWAYGPGGDKLKGKKLHVSVTAGAPSSAYCNEGYNRYDLDTFMAPWNQTAILCGMTWIPYRVLHDSRRATREEIHHHAMKFRADLARFQEKGSFE